MSFLQVRLEGREPRHLDILRALSWSLTPQARLFGAFRRGLLLRRRTGALMSASEAAAMEEELRGLSLPEVEVCPPFSVREVFAVEARGDNIWDSGVPEVTDDERSLRLFVCFVLDAMYRGGDVTCLTQLWDSVATTDVSYQSLLGGGCRKDVVVRIFYR